MSDKSGPAFPPHWNPETHESGLTKREWFAAMALQGLLANDGDVRAESIPGVARRAFMWADAMIEEAAK